MLRIPRKRTHWLPAVSAFKSDRKDKPKQAKQGDSWDPVLVAGDAMMLMATELVHPSEQLSCP